VSLSPGPGPDARLGLTVGRKVGGAVARNRLKRRIREVLRTHWDRLPAGTDVVVVALPGAARLGHDEVRTQVLEGLRRVAGEGRG
jgi:ribonuclease P protein component